MLVFLYITVGIVAIFALLYAIIYGFYKGTFMKVIWAFMSFAAVICIYGVIAWAIYGAYVGMIKLIPERKDMQIFDEILYVLFAIFLLLIFASILRIVKGSFDKRIIHITIVMGIILLVYFAFISLYRNYQDIEKITIILLVLVAILIFAVYNTDIRWIQFALALASFVFAFSAMMTIYKICANLYTYISE